MLLTLVLILKFLRCFGRWVKDYNLHHSLTHSLTLTLTLKLKLHTGCSSARLECTSGGREVAGSNPVIPTKTKQGASVIAGGPFFVQYEPSLLERAMNEKRASRRRNPSDLWNNPRSWITQGNPVIPTKTKQGSSVIAGGPFLMCKESKF
jgi:hypothetical protein